MKLPRLALGLLTLSLAAGCAHENQERLQAEARVSESQARQTALDKVPGGTIKESELEHEHGHLQWSFDVAIPGEKDITEVNVDAVSGEILSVSKESAKD